MGIATGISAQGLGPSARACPPQALNARPHPARSARGDRSLAALRASSMDRSDPRSLAGAPTVPLDSSHQLDDYPTQPCGARRWMQACGFAVSASRDTRKRFETIISMRWCCRKGRESRRFGAGDVAPSSRARPRAARDPALVVGSGAHQIRTSAAGLAASGSR
jgi:hypothetical protein